MCTWVDSLFAACPDYSRGIDCRALLPGEDCTTCARVDEDVPCPTLCERWRKEAEPVPAHDDRGGDLSTPVAANDGS